MHDDFSKRDNRKPNKHKRHDKNEDEYWCLLSNWLQNYPVECW
jgi:hypothetical protein